jgi:N-acetylgalactosamine kinase
MDLTAANAVFDEPVFVHQGARSCWVPGRVTLLGEHLDYNGLPVLAMPIDRGLHVSFSRRADDEIHLESDDPSFPPIRFRLPAKGPAKVDGWGRYVAQAVARLQQELRLKERRGFHLQVQSTLPAAAGLASSSALTVAAGLAFLAVHDLELEVDVDRAELAEWLAEAERGIGTQGGCMDHAAMLLGSPHSACKIDFIPLRTEAVELPAGYTLVVSHSLVHADKGGAAQHCYNEGPRIGRILCALIERQLQEEFDDPELELPCLGELWFGPMCLSLAEVEALCNRAIPKPRYTQAEIRARLGHDKRNGVNLFDELPEPAGGYPLQARLRHQISEFRRVEAGRDALLMGDALALGQLMNASHQSCADDCGVSCAELDQLSAIARDAGAVGSRMTGAGFGGAVISLVPSKDVERFQAELHREYYQGRLGIGQTAPVFCVEPGSPARYG